jgi:hypothetical protein
MSVFDKMAGISEGVALTRRPLKTLGEAGGAERSTTDATVDYGDPPGPERHGTPNSAYRPQPKQSYGGDETMKGKEKARATRTSKPAQAGAK